MSISEDAIEVPIVFVIPTDVLEVLESLLFNFLGHLLKTGKRIARRGRPR